MVKNKFRDMPKFNNIKGILLNSVKLYPNNIAFTTKVQKDKKVEYIEKTYSEFLEDINCFGTALYNLGLKDKRIAVIGRNRYEWAVAHLSNLLGGMVSVPLDKELQIEELENSLVRSEVEAIVFDEKYTENIEQIVKNGKTNIKYYICMSKHSEYKNIYDLMQEGKKLISNGDTEYINSEIDSNKMSILLFTSGTTSNAKAVMLSQIGIATNVYDMQIVETFLDTDVNIAFVPYHHIFGSTGIMVMLASGIKTVFPDGLKYIKQNLNEYGVSVFIGVPILIEKMYQNIEKEIERQGKTRLINIAIKISNLLMKLNIDVRRKLFKQIIDQLGGKMRFIVSGGAALDKDILYKFKQFGIHIVQGYGLTETSPVISAENDIYTKEGSVGIPMKSASVEVVNKDKDGIGEIIVKSISVMLGYYKNEEETNKVLKDGWFYTGDLGYIDDEGFVFVTGRKKDMIVLKNGKKIFPEELETVVNKIEEIEESYVYGMPNKDDENDVKLSVKIVYDPHIVKEKYNDISEDNLREILWNKIKEVNTTLPKYKYIKNMILTKEPLIKTSTQKIKRNEEIKKCI